MQPRHSTKSHPVFLRKPDSSSFPPSLPLSHHSLHHHQPPIFTCCCHQGNRQFKKLLLSNGRQYAASSWRDRKRERERPSSLSTKRYYCLATIHGLPHLPHPHHPLSLSREKKKQAGHEKYTVKGPLQKIIMGCLRLRWLWSFGGKAYIMHKLPWDVW